MRAQIKAKANNHLLVALNNLFDPNAVDVFPVMLFVGRRRRLVDEVVADDVGIRSTDRRDLLPTGTSRIPLSQSLRFFKMGYSILK